MTLDEARTVEAEFNLQKRSLTVSTSGTGTGTVTTNPPGSTFDHGTSVTLEAASAKGSTFTGWGGACSGLASTCTLTMNEARTVDAGFKLDLAPPGADPVIRKLKVAPRKVRLKGKSKSAVRNKGPLVTIKLSEAATVRLSLRGKKGKTWTVKRARAAGTSKFRLPGKIRKKLKPGRYRLTAVATDKAGRTSKASKTRFRVVR